MGKKSMQKNEKNTLFNDFVLEAKKRMLEWPNPLEYVNNMYGCHPDINREYFQTVYENKNRLQS